MSEVLTIRHYALLLLITALLTTGGFRLVSWQPEKFAITEEAAPSISGPASQPLFPGQPDREPGR